jgi:hypothetical protein
VLSGQSGVEYAEPYLAGAGNYHYHDRVLGHRLGQRVTHLHLGRQREQAGHHVASAGAGIHQPPNREPRHVHKRRHMPEGCNSAVTAVTRGDAGLG